MAWGVTVLVAAGLLAAVHSYQETLVEDPTAEYYVGVIRNLIANTSQSLQGALTRLEANTAKEGSLADLWGSLKGVEDSVAAVKENIFAIRDSVDNGVDRTRVEFRLFQDRVSEQLDGLRTLVEHRTSRLEEQVARMSKLSVNQLASDCQDLFDMGFNASGVYYLQKFGQHVLCEMERGDGGWLVVQRRARVAQQVNFDRGWDEYKRGFGSHTTEFWLGNDFLHILTNQKTYQLYIDMNDYEKGPYWAAYSSFRVAGEDSGYALSIGNYSGNTTDAFHYHHGRPFSTTDRDNDLYTTGNCAEQFTGAWWYDRCYDAHLNGLFPVVPDRENASFITWWAYEEGEKVPLVLDKVTLRVKPAPT